MRNFINDIHGMAFDDLETEVAPAPIPFKHSVELPFELRNAAIASSNVRI
jgi:hypothetical protein